MDRRNFIKFSAFVGATPLLAEKTQNHTNTKDVPMASIIDLDLCDGCKDFPAPKCVIACRDKNIQNFPEPKLPLRPYWPQSKYEDYSKKRDDISRLTPYNWTFIESVEVDHKSVFIPRRCMHCDNPPCQKLCPFGVISKDGHGAVDIDKEFCFGGAKCRDTCPWNIPQRQAGVGIYLNIAPKLAGGGVMYKCDMCKDLLKQGQKPKCEVACPKNAVIFDTRENIMARLKDEKRHIYGLDENGGTSTIYVSSVSFEDIDNAIAQKYESKKNKIGTPHMKRVDNPLEQSKNLAIATLLAPLSAVVGAGIMVYKANKKDSK